MPDILGFLGSLLKPAERIVDEVFTSKEESAALKNELVRIKTALATRLLQYESKIAEHRGKIALAETASKSKLASTWRPFLMWVVIAIVVNNYLIYPYLSMVVKDMVYLDIPEWLLTFVSSAYILGRTGEKVLPKLFNGNGNGNKKKE